MKVKLIIGTVVVLLVIIAGQFFYYKHTNSQLRDENEGIILKKEKELKKVRDSAFIKIEGITIKSNERFDSILNLPPTYRWKKFEVPVYIDRTLDEAFDIHEEHKVTKIN